MHALFNQCFFLFTDIFFWRNSWWHFFIMYILMFCKCKRWRSSQSLCLSIQFIISLMLSSDVLISRVLSSHISSFLLSSCYFKHVTLIPTLEGLSIAHVEKHRCLLCKSLIIFKVILPTQSIQLDAVVCTKLFTNKRIAVKF
jgi:hypothetical protein